MNLDKLLKKIEINKKKTDEQKTHTLVIGGETYEVKTLTRARKRDYLYSNEIGKTNMTIGELVKKSIPYIYHSLELGQLAERAKADKLIVRNFDIVELLFEPEEIVEIIGFISEINNFGGGMLEEDVEEVKKQ